MSDIGTTLRRLTEITDASYPDSVLHPVDPTITSLVPSTVSAAAAATTIQVNGTNFEDGSVVEVNQVAQATTFVSATRLTISFDPTVAGSVNFTVRNPNEEESNTVAMVVSALAADDVSSWTIDEVKDFIADNPGLLSEVEKFEQNGKARVTLLEWLRELLDEENDGDDDQ
jgi:hypothetical protein